MNVKYEGISCQWHCPNCGALVQGIKNGDGIAKGECRSCGSSMVRKFMGRRHDRLIVYKCAPDCVIFPFPQKETPQDESYVSSCGVPVMKLS